MRILIIVNEFPPDRFAGTALSTERLARHLSLRGHAVAVLVTTAVGIDRGPEKLPGYMVRWLHRGAPKGLGWLERFKWVYGQSKRFQPQIIQGQAVSCGLLAALAGRCLKVPSIAYAQGQDVYQAGKWQMGTEIRWGCRWPDRVAAVSSHLAGLIKKTTGRQDVQVLPHGFEDCPLAAESGFKKTGSGPLILAVGRLELIKGQDLLLKSWPGIKAVYPDANLWLAGDGSQRSFLETICTQLKIQQSVHFLGHLQPADVSAVADAADLFVLPSRSEAFGIVLLEAMARGLPVVATRTGGVPEIVTREVDGLLIEPDNVPDLTFAILQALQLFKKPSIINQKWAEKFRWETLVGRFDELYGSLVAESEPLPRVLHRS